LIVLHCHRWFHQRLFKFKPHGLRTEIIVK
jgi:hypothetical protein